MSDPMKARKRPPKPTDADLARHFGVSTKTISRWRRDGAPLHDARGMQQWLSQRRQVPPAAMPELARARLAEVGERVRRLRLANDREEGRLVARAWVVGKIQLMLAELKRLEHQTLAELPLRLAEAGHDVAQNRSALRGVWDSIMDLLRGLGEHLREGDPE